jgi:hypothetical protein
MGLFRPSSQFTQMRTPEEQYREAQQRPQPQATATAGRATTDAQREVSEAFRRQRAAKEERRSKVLSSGTLRRRGRTVILEGDWKLATGSLPVGEIPRVTHGKVGDLTLKDLHALATNHGPKCRCGIDR